MGCWLHEVPSRVNEVGCGPWNSIAWASPRLGGEMPAPNSPASCGSLCSHWPVNSCWLQLFGDWSESCWNGPWWACVSRDWRNGLLPGRDEDFVPVGQGFLRGLTVSQKVEHSHTWNRWIMGLAQICGGEYIITRSDEFLSKIYVLEVLFELIY